MMTGESPRPRRVQRPRFAVCNAFMRRYERRREEDDEGSARLALMLSVLALWSAMHWRSACA